MSGLAQIEERLGAALSAFLDAESIAFDPVRLMDAKLLIGEIEREVRRLAQEQPTRLSSLFAYDQWKSEVDNSERLRREHAELWARSSNAFRRAFYQAWDASEGRQIWAALFILLRFSDLVFRTVKLELDGRPPEVRPRSPFVYAME